MKTALPPAFLTLLALSACALAQETAALPNPSFELAREGRPMGWRVFPLPREAQGDFYVTAGEEGADTHTGSAAIRFSFPDGAELEQCAWTADPVNGGMAAEAGWYSCSFWIKGEDLRPDQHAWVEISGFGADNKSVGKLGRSEYLKGSDLPFGEWTLVKFSFEVPADSAVVRIAPTVIFKTDPRAKRNFVPPTTLVAVDDLEISRD